MDISNDVQLELIRADEDEEPNSSGIPYEYLDPSDSSTLVEEEDKLVYMHFNIRSLASNFDEFKLFLAQLDAV